MGTNIIAAGVKFDIGCRVVLWDDPDGLSFYAPVKKYNSRNIEMDELRNDIKTFVLHHSATYTAKQTYTGLISRGLSVNFIIDDDNIDGVATIYQCLDIKDAAWSHAPLNNNGPGVEICYQPMASVMANAYSSENCKRYGVTSHPIVSDTIHGNVMRIFPPSLAQVEAVAALLWGFVELFPNVSPTFPKNADGSIVKTTIDNPIDYTGLLAHFNITRNKIDPAGFPFSDVENKIRQRMTLGF